MRATLPWFLTGVSVAAVAADTVATARYSGVWSEAAVSDHGWPFVELGTLLSAVIGALIVTRHSRHHIGWLLLIVGTLASLSSLAESYGLWVINSDGPGTLAAGELARWYSQLTGATPAFASLAVLFLLAPDGHLVSRRSRLVLWAAFAGLALWVVGMFNVAPSAFRKDIDAARISVVANVSLTLAVLVIIVAVIASAVSFLGRLRRARGEVRQQLRWIAVPIGLFPLTLLFLLAVQLITQENNLWYQGLPVYVDYAALTICTGVAVLRHRLYDIDVIVNRAVLLAGAVVLVTAGYVGIVVAIGGSIPGFWPSVIATTVVALAFQPARRGLVRVADRLAYGPRAAPLEELAEFNRQIGESTDPTSLLPALAAAAAQAVGAAAVSVQLEVGSAKELRAQWPTSSADLVDPAVFAVLDGDDQLGSIAVVTRPGRPLRDRERALLTDLAAQAAPAFRNAALAARLTEQVDLLDVRSGELNRSRARLIAARDAERARIARTVRREVTPYLEDVEARLAADPDVDLDRMIGSVNAALDALRRITHGIFPVHLARSGLTAALRSQLTDTALVAGTDARFDRSVELTAYFCSVEAVELIEPPARVTVTDDSSALRIQVAGTAVRYNDLALLIDRLAPLGGQAQFADGAHVEIYIPTRVNALPTAIPASVVPG
jgi:hypothetical protein